VDLQSKSNLAKVEKLNSQSQNQLVQEFPKEEAHVSSMLNVATGFEIESKLYVFSYSSSCSLYYV
jgi:protein EFR3